MNDLLIYPFNYKNRELVQFNELLKDYRLTAAVIPNKIDSELKRFKQSAKDILITDNYDEGLKLCDTVLFLDGIDSDYSLYAEKINTALQSNKEVFVAKTIEQKLRDIVGDTVFNNVKIIGGGESLSNLKKSDHLKRINVPVIAILGLGEYCGKFSCEIALQRYFREKGYSVLQFGSKDYSELFGFQGMPADIFMQNIPTAKKALLFNQYLYQAYKKADPDIIILGIPEGIMPVNHRIFNNFGEMAGIVGQAVQIDISMLGVYYQSELNEQYFKYIEKLRDYSRYKFNCPTDYIFISNTYSQVDENDEAKLNYYHYETVPPVGQITLDGDSTIKFFNVEDKNSITEVFDKMHNELLSNIAVL